MLTQALNYHYFPRSSQFKSQLFAVAALPASLPVGPPRKARPRSSRPSGFVWPRPRVGASRPAPGLFCLLSYPLFPRRSRSCTGPPLLSASARQSSLMLCLRPFDWQNAIDGNKCQIPILQKRGSAAAFGGAPATPPMRLQNGQCNCKEPVKRDY